MKLSTKFVACIVFIFSTSAVTAQKNAQSTTVVGKDTYDRLYEAQQEYDEIIKTGDSLKVAEISYIIGKRYISIGDYYNADKWFFRSLRILEPLGPSENLGKVYTYMTNSLLANNQFDEAFELMKKAIINFRSVGDKEREMGAYIMLGGIHNLGNKARLKEPDKYARYSLDSSRYYTSIADNLGKKIKNLTLGGNIGFSNNNSYIHEDTSFIIKTLEKNYNVAIKKGPSLDLFSYTADLSKYYLSKNNVAIAEYWLEKASSIINSLKADSFDQRLGLVKLYMELYEKKQDYKKALEFYRQYHELELKALNADRNGAISRLKIAYETEKKEIALKQQQRVTKIAVAIGFLILIVSIVFFRLFRKYKVISRQNALLVEEQNHRVKNNFQHITNLLTLQKIRLDDGKTKGELNETLLRIEAMALVQQRLYDRQNLVEVELYNLIPKLTEGILQSYSIFNCHPEYSIGRFLLHVEQAIPLGLILNELITNSCKYAFTSKNNIPTLKIECNLKSGIVSLLVIDNGPGFDFLESKGFGLKLIQALSERLKGNYSFTNYGREFRLNFKKINSLVMKGQVI